MALTALVKKVGDTEAAVRREAAGALERFGPAAKEAVPALVAALADRDFPVVLAVRDALKRIDPEAARKAGVP
jgi:HEAT repeat protein